VHRAGQIIERVVEILKADATLAAEVFPYLELTLSGPDQQLPAVAVRMGGDDFTEFRSTAIVESRLAVHLVAYAEAPTEPELMAELLRLRAACHRAVLADRSLGLAFVHQASYVGAEPPDINTEGAALTGRLEGRFSVAYWMNQADPE
jgi:hypothetical protein